MARLPDIEMHVPRLWHRAIANVLLVGERRGRCTQADTTSWLGFLVGLPVQVDAATEAQAWSDTINVAQQHGLTEHDAAYLELALAPSKWLCTIRRLAWVALAAASAEPTAGDEGWAVPKSRKGTQRGFDHETKSSSAGAGLARRLRPLQTVHADFPHTACPNPLVKGMHRQSTVSRLQAAGRGAADGRMTIRLPACGRPVDCSCLAF